MVSWENDQVHEERGWHCTHGLVDTDEEHNVNIFGISQRGILPSFAMNVLR